MVAKDRVDCRITHHRVSLAEKCRGLSTHLLLIATQLESDTPHTNLRINDLGEIQAQGPTIDAECGRLMGKIDVWFQM